MKNKTFKYAFTKDGSIIIRNALIREIEFLEKEYIEKLLKLEMHGAAHIISRDIAYLKSLIKEINERFELK